jgi:flagellin
MAFSIVTNVASLLAQDNLRITSNFQQTTIQRLTSGLRINSSADDAAGLAIANSFRSDIAVLQQGVRNAGDGLSTLQTIDGGINNISLLLDRARTLAAQSASGTFTGDRGPLSSEFQSVLNEIDRQAQAIGLDQGGTFAKALSVFIGGGRGHAGDPSSVAINNGTVGIDLSNSTVDAKSLGLKGLQALGGVAGTTDIGPGSAATNVAAILANSTNTASEAVSGNTVFYFAGPGFSDVNKIAVSVNLNGVVDTTTLATAINSAIQAAGNGTSQAAAAFKNANIKAVINTDSTGKQQLSFTSATTAFQVEAGDRLANALLGNYTSSSDPTGLSTAETLTGAGNLANATAAETVTLKVAGPGFTNPQFVTLNIGASDTAATIVSNLNAALAANSTLAAAGYSASGSAGNPLVISNTRGEAFQVYVAGDTNNYLGLGTALTGASNAVTYTTITGGATDATVAATGSISMLIEGAGGSGITISATGGAGLTTQNLADQLNSAITANPTLQAAGLKVTVTAGTSAATGSLNVISSNGTHFQLTSTTTNAVTGFGTIAGALTTGTLAEPTQLTFDSGGAQGTSGTSATAPTAFTPLFYGNDVQNLVFTTTANGTQHSLSIQLANANAATLDQALNTINAKLQQSNDPALQSIVAVKEKISGNAEGIKFLSGSSTPFTVGIGNTASGNGVSTAGNNSLLTSSALPGGSTTDISSQANAEAAVSSLATAVTLLAGAQATVGKGQNQLNYAVNLASTQVNNLSVAEGRIRDADLAAEAANLTKASIALQSGIAALAQANSAPQAVLALLRG